MTLQSSGAISLANVQGEFGGSEPIYISEYYGLDTGIPGGGTISLSDFYGKSNVKYFYPIGVRGNWLSNNAVIAQYFKPQIQNGTLYFEMYGYGMRQYYPDMYSALSYGTEWRNEGEWFMIRAASFGANWVSVNLSVGDIYYGPYPDAGAAGSWRWTDITGTFYSYN